MKENKISLGIEIHQSMRDEVDKAVSRRNKDSFAKHTRTSFVEEAIVGLLSNDDEIVNKK